MFDRMNTELYAVPMDELLKEVARRALANSAGMIEDAINEQGSNKNVPTRQELLEYAHEYLTITIVEMMADNDPNGDSDLGETPFEQLISQLMRQALSESYIQFAVNPR